MSRKIRLVSCTFALLFAGSTSPAADAAGSAGSVPGEMTAAERTTAAAAAVTVLERQGARQPDFLEHLVDSILALFDMRTTGNTMAHYAIAALLLVIALLARRIVTGVFFAVLRKIAARTRSTFDDKLLPALEVPASAFVMLVGIFAALKVLKLSDESDAYISFGSRFAFSLVIFWGFWRTLDVLLAHAATIAQQRKMGVAAFMPWLKKTLMVVFAIVGGLTIIQNLGYGESVKTVLAGLGIGGLAFALAAQDTLANIFGAVVVAIDQPFKIGEVVRIGTNVGFIEDIGLRSTRIRLIDRSLMVVPNKTVAAETITNLSRFTHRRNDQVIGLTYDTKPEQMDAIVEEFRQIILAEPEVDPTSVMVFFRDYGASSLDVWIVYMMKGPDFITYMNARQRINLAFMRAVEARGLSFAFPTQTLHLAGEIAERMSRKDGSGLPPGPLVG
ncbi:MAG: mechanosensitive ion channel family protein [Opitutus sp.]